MGLLGNLFSDKKMTIDDCALMIQDFMREIGVPPEPLMNDKDKITWALTRGSATIHIGIFKDEEYPTIRAFSPILNLPDKHILPLYRKCLELNMGLLTCAFAVHEDKIVVVSERSIEGLDSVELAEMVSWLSHIADEWDDKLAEEFETTLANI